MSESGTSQSAQNIVPITPASNCSNCQALIATVKELADKVSSLETRLSIVTEKLETKANSWTADPSSSDWNTVDGTKSPQSNFNQDEFNSWKKYIEELVEARTNRQLRKTLVFRNIREEQSEKSWEDTDNVLASAIADSLNEVNEGVDNEGEDFSEAEV